MLLILRQPPSSQTPLDNWLHSSKQAGKFKGEIVPVPVKRPGACEFSAFINGDVTHIHFPVLWSDTGAVAKARAHPSK